MLEGGKSCTNRFPRSMERKGKERPRSMPLENSSSAGEILDEFGGLNAFENSPLSRESTKGYDRCREYNSEQLFGFLTEKMKGVIFDQCRKYFSLTFQTLFVVSYRCTAIVIGERFIYCSMSVKQTEEVLVIEQV